MSSDGPMRSEVGSEFEWVEPDSIPSLYEPWPRPHLLFALGQHIIPKIWFAQSRRGVLWVPDYFCPPVVDAWNRAQVPMSRYRDDPRQMQPDWGTLQPSAGDMVLAVNYFGLRAANEWRAWKADHPGVGLIEDHSHDPASPWAHETIAEYAFASLRKTLPIPDGAIVWSPRGLPLPAAATRRSFGASALKLAAMVLKRDYLTARTDDKATYRDLQLRGEAALLATEDLAISPWSATLVGSGVPLAWRRQRSENVGAFAAALAEIVWLDVLRPRAPECCPFNGVVVFESPAARDAVRHALIAGDVYAAIHWEQPAAAPRHVLDLSRRILTIPLDQRYDRSHVARITEIIVQTRDRRPRASSR